MQRAKKWAALLLMMSLSLVLAGCAMPKLTLDPEELYALPELPARYTTLNQQLNAIQESGAEYAAPVSGSNIQPVQMVDLDGDGREEALAFFRQSDGEKPLKIYVFTDNGNSYTQTAVIEGSGLAVYSIAYSDMNGDGRMEIIVGWRVSMDLQALAVYALEPGGARELARSNYVKYAVADLNGDGMQELTVFRANQDGVGAADCYLWKNGALTLSSTIRVSMTMAELSQQGKVTVGTLRSGEPALFVTGVAEGMRAMTDVLLLRGGELNNAVLSPTTGVSGESSRFRALYPADINGDGVTEVPRTVALYGEELEGDTAQRVDWISFDAAGAAIRVLSTYHAIEDGWYLQLPDGWADTICVGRSSSADEASVTFYMGDSRDQSYTPVLRITTLSGSNRERLAVRTGRFILGRNDGVIYAGELLKGNEGWADGVTEDEVRNAFSLIAPEWSAGDN
ncbi:MAG: VCBS repeat-containing protein [Oscillibacter sp.]|nr:VCBS repeat-containing protein [Dysosmobacter sp.]MDD6408616.1 VCBS repeat-containing protein [Oscillibacter sp.]MDY3867498.1 VCBS repeat-containing protein [Dysosmobacter sp.]